MLDDLTVMHERDTQDALSAVEQQARQLRGHIDVPQHRVTASSIIVCARSHNAFVNDSIIYEPPHGSTTYAYHTYTHT